MATSHRTCSVPSNCKPCIFFTSQLCECRPELFLKGFVAYTSKKWINDHVVLLTEFWQTRGSSRFRLLGSKKGNDTFRSFCHFISRLTEWRASSSCHFFHLTWDRWNGFSAVFLRGSGRSSRENPVWTIDSPGRGCAPHDHIVKFKSRRMEHHMTSPGPDNDQKAIKSNTRSFYERFG
jgi:hypothetical protein